MASEISAQTRVRTPDKGVIGYGVDAGVLFPDEAFENTLTIDGFGEYYVTPRMSVRGMLAFASPGLSGRTEDHFRQMKLLFSGVYNWEKGSVAAVRDRSAPASTSSGCTSTTPTIRPAKRAAASTSAVAPSSS